MNTQDCDQALEDYMATFGLGDVAPLVLEMVKLGVPNDLAVQVVRSIAAHRLKQGVS